MKAQKPVKVFVTFVTPYLFGMERAVIEIFEDTQPEITPHFLLTYTTFRLKLPVLSAVKNANISYSFLSDKKDWPTPRKPRSVREAFSILKALILANKDTLRACRGKDIFYIPSLRATYSVLLTVLYYRLQGKPVVYAFHDTLNKPSRLLKILGPLISHYVFHSTFTREQFEASNPWAVKRQSAVIPYIVKYRPTASPSLLPSNSRVILFVGQIAAYKGADLLIEAFLLIKDQYPDVSLHFVGTPHDDFSTQFSELLHSKEAEGRIIHWGYREDVHDFLKSAYVFVQPSRPSLVAESFGRGVVEASAAGVPSVCFRSGALPEHVIHEETGLICEEESAQCLSEQIGRLLNSSALRDAYGHHACNRYEAYYAPEKVKHLWVAFFQSLMVNG